MDKTIFTGGFFKIENHLLKFFCNDKKLHGKELSLEACYEIKNMHLQLSNLSSYTEEGGYCNLIKGGLRSIVVEPARIKALIHLSAMEVPEEEIAFYLRSWGYIELPDLDSIILKLSEYTLMEIVDINSSDFDYYEDREKLKGRRMHVFNRNLTRDPSLGNLCIVNNNSGIPNLMLRTFHKNAYDGYTQFNEIKCRCFYVKPLGTSSFPRLEDIKE